MNKAFEICLYVAVPVAWGLLVDFIFERRRRRRTRRRQEREGRQA